MARNNRLKATYRGSGGNVKHSFVPPPSRASALRLLRPISPDFKGYTKLREHAQEAIAPYLGATVFKRDTVGSMVLSPKVITTVRREYFSELSDDEFSTQLTAGLGKESSLWKPAMAYVTTAAIFGRKGGQVGYGLKSTIERAPADARELGATLSQMAGRAVKLPLEEHILLGTLPDRLRGVEENAIRTHLLAAAPRSTAIPLEGATFLKG